MTLLARIDKDGRAWCGRSGCKAHHPFGRWWYFIPPKVPWRFVNGEPDGDRMPFRMVVDRPDGQEWVRHFVLVGHWGRRFLDLRGVYHRIGGHQRGQQRAPGPFPYPWAEGPLVFECPDCGSNQTIPDLSGHSAEPSREGI